MYRAHLDGKFYIMHDGDKIKTLLMLIQTIKLKKKPHAL